ncbi:hypothetical protein JL722_11425 [Aureococcus anophagefferens]|nr:hypothetical protein JL722_11425 [Aureococcus anophagefferens]
MAPAKPKKSALRTAASGGRTCKRVRWKEDLVQHLDGAGAAPAAAPPPSGFQFAQLTTVSRKAVTPLFNIPTTAHRNANAKKRLWGEAWPSPAPPDDGGGDDDGEYETVLEWFCDECQAPIPDDATRYECAVCPADYCRCAACYRAGVPGRGSLAGAVVGALGLACLLRRPASSAGGALRLEAAAPLRFGARGSYATTAGVGYPWLDGEVLVEPFRETTLYAVNHNGEAVTWMVNGAHAIGEETSRTFDKVGEHSVWLETRTRASRRASFVDAEGARAYGRAYKSAAYFIATHNELSGDRTCDHFHDGLGFLPQHAAFTLRFERALQSVDPRVSVPYWDYTIEAHDVAVAGDMAAWRRSPVFRDDWFGDAQPEGHVVNAGRWAYTAVARASPSDTANAYGLIRARPGT